MPGLPNEFDCNEQHFPDNERRHFAFPPGIGRAWSKQP